MSKVQFKVNDMVIYPAHGVGQILAVEAQKIGGFDIEVYAVSFLKEKMTLRVPVSRAVASGLRALSSKTELDSIIEIMQGKPKNTKGMWSRRAKEYDTKINSGILSEIAEVIRDLHRNVEDNPDCSYSERMVYESALSRFVAEFAAINNMSMEQAHDEVIAILINY